MWTDPERGGRPAGPPWWQLYGLVALLLGVLIWLHQLGLTASAEAVLQIGAMLIFLGAVLGWMRRVEAAGQFRSETEIVYRVIVIPPRRAAAPAPAPPRPPEVADEISGRVLD